MFNIRKLYSLPMAAGIFLIILFLSGFWSAGSCQAENGAKFAPAEDPFVEFVKARNANQPLVVEFYARW
ncbi:MAG: hypothetical protein SVV67_06800 [Bacillota bacterium]|nr:hypothetical protein [Bacillota bacterium]